MDKLVNDILNMLMIMNPEQIDNWFENIGLKTGEIHDNYALLIIIINFILWIIIIWILRFFKHFTYWILSKL